MLTNKTDNIYNSHLEFHEKRMRVSKITKDPFQQIELFENEPPRERLLHQISVVYETLLYNRDIIEIHSSDLNLIFKAMLHLTKLTREDLSNLEYCYVLSNLDHVSTKVLNSCEELRTYSDSPMVQNNRR